MMDFKKDSRVNELGYSQPASSRLYYLLGHEKLNNNPLEVMNATNRGVVGNKLFPGEIQVPYPRTVNIIRSFEQVPLYIKNYENQLDQFRRMRTDVYQKNIYPDGNWQKL